MCGNAEMWKCGNAEMQHFWMGFGFEFVRLTKHIRAIIADHLVENLRGSVEKRWRKGPSAVT